MRAIDLKQILGAPIDDAAILAGVASSLGISYKSKTKILSAYKTYKRRKGSTGIGALQLDPALAAKLSGLYSGKAAKHGLAWIKQLAKTTKCGYCPMCGAETHKTIEHFLPRKPWSEFSILSLNLVPSCGNCNSKRSNHASSPTAKHRLFHPYFDVNVLSQRLHVTKISGPFVGPTYEPMVVSGLAPAVRAKVQNHLTKNIDLDVYQQYCTNRWSEMQMEAREANTAAELASRIKFHAASSLRLYGHNTWRTAFFSAMESDPTIASWLFANRHTF
jgi:5-methylcytosine-specific restriction endonuclease McrA